MSLLDAPTLAHYLVLGAILFAISVAGIFLNRNNVIMLLMAIELMLLAVNLNFIAFSRYLGDTAGQVFVFFILTVAAAESAIGLAILVLLFRNMRHDRRRGPRISARRADATIATMTHQPLSARRRSRRWSASIVVGLCGRAARPRRRRTGCAILGVAVSFVASIVMLARRAGRPRRSTATSTRGSSSGDLKLAIGFLIDPLTATDDARRDVRVADGARLHDRLHGRRSRATQRFFCYISLFTFSMLMLVMSNNFLQLFFGWEAVGLVSYLLIGFWYTRPTAIYANLKAFLVNRVGDFGFLLGIGARARVLRHARLRAGVREAPSSLVGDDDRDLLGGTRGR